MDDWKAVLDHVQNKVKVARFTTIPKGRYEGGTLLTKKGFGLLIMKDLM